MPMKTHGVFIAAEYRFIRIAKDYALVYTERGKPNIESCIEVDEAKTKILTKNDLRWIYECNVIILSELAKENEKTVCAEVSKKIALIEKKLSEEKEKLLNGGG